MTILPGLTSTEKDRIAAFVDDLRASEVRAIALFPTMLEAGERTDLYHALAAIPGLSIPHVHLRSDCTADEMQFVIEQFNTELFNIHPSASRHSFPAIPPGFASRIWVENVEIPPSDADLDAVGGICPDYAHLESARRMGNAEYVATVERQLAARPIGCCHVSAIREGEPNRWNGGPDHHNFHSLSDLDYMARYAGVLPPRWISLELENPFGEQLDAVDYLTGLLGLACDHAAISMKDSP